MVNITKDYNNQDSINLSDIAFKHQPLFNVVLSMIVATKNSNDKFSLNKVLIFQINLRKTKTLNTAHKHENTQYKQRSHN